MPSESRTRWAPAARLHFATTAAASGDRNGTAPVPYTLPLYRRELYVDRHELAASLGCSQRTASSRSSHTSATWQPRPLPPSPGSRLQVRVSSPFGIAP